MPLISTFHSPSSLTFQREIAPLRRPAILQHIPLGECTTKWTSEYLVEAVDGGKLVVVHESTSPRLRFLNKNFTYETMPFAEFIKKAAGNELEEENKFYYYRALADQDPRRNASGGLARCLLDL